MNISQMKNMIILKDLPSNIVDEAIVILKTNAKVKNKEKIENKNLDKSKENNEDNYDFVIKEAEYIIQDYIQDVEKPNQIKSKDINYKYKRLQISSLFLGLTVIALIILSVIR